MVLHKHIKPRFLALLALSTLLASASQAQTAAPKSDVNPSVAAPFQSAFEGYRAYSDDAITDWKASNWKAANDNVAQIGGWREYARQAQQPDTTVSPANQAPVAAPTPTTKAKP